MATVPTPPAKPIPPTAPTVSPVTMTTSSDSPTNATTISGNKVNPEMSALGREVEGLTKAFQGTSAPSSSGDKSSLAPQTENQMTEASKTTPVGVLNKQDEASTRSTVPNHQIPENKGSSWGMVWFVVVIMVVAVILIGLRQFKDRRRQRNTTSANFGRTNTSKDELAVDVAVPKQSTMEKVKSNFDFRV